MPGIIHLARPGCCFQASSVSYQSNRLRQPGWTLRNRDEDFSGRLPVGGYRASSLAPVQGGVVFYEEQFVLTE